MLDFNHRILIVDDGASMRNIMKKILKQIGYRNFMEAEDGSEALNVLRKELVDLVVLDWNMPQMTGIELLKIMRGDQELKGIPVLMVTAEAKKSNVLEAIHSGVNNYIVKPFTPGTMKEKIEHIFKVKSITSK